MDVVQMLGVMLGGFFAHPLLYIGVVAIFVMSLHRVSKERASFHTRVLAKRADMIIPFLPSLVMGVLISLVTVSLGVVLPFSALLLLLFGYVLMVATAQVHVMSPVYALGSTLVAIVVLDGASVPGWLEVSTEVVPGLFLLLALLLVAESLLILKNGPAFTSPQLERGKRGKWIGVHLAKRLWILPVVLFIPEGLIPAAGYWPVFSLGETSFQPLLVPFLIGFQMKKRSAPPQEAIRTYGHRSLGFALLALALACTYVAWPVPWLLVVMVLVLLGVRVTMTLLPMLTERTKTAFFTESREGCTIVGVIPGSPAAKMNLKPGEQIVKVNGLRVSSEENFYAALQQNAVYCKLDVRDLEGEIRFEQGALYAGQHHQVGVLLVRTETKLSNSVV
ncbi:PDZ domain-containing protein [Shouchella shacheensis]|uniref:PDZ domain-containing protein n=1 Tax=Shouchella shacheensis TaxID=1649580 RepID=UPI00073FC92F|nr:PDZ domain-containing protein [Shouchella shacheensis]